MRRFRYLTLITSAVMTICCVSCADETKIDSIAVTKAPDKTVYVVGEMLDVTGMEVFGYYGGNKVGEITSYDYSPRYYPLLLTNTEIEITYTTKSNQVLTTTCQIVVNPADDPTVSRIAVTTNPTKTSYYVGDNFDKTGMVVTAYKTDGTSMAVTSFTVSPSTNLQLTDTSVTICYGGKTATVSISVTEKDSPTPPGPVPTGYYAGINENSSTLLSDLQSLNRTKRQRTIGYKQMKTSSPFENYKYTDYDPATVQTDASGHKYGTKLIQFYQGKSATSGMNKEHVWPDSLYGSYVEDDIHMPRPTDSDDNGSRGNEFYVEGRHGPAKPYKETGWDPGAFSDLDATYRGDSARIIFYCVVADSRLRLIDAESGSKGEMGKLSDLLKWNLQYPVQQREQNRNEGAEYLQGNRNPFIDHPEYACKIWGKTNSTTRQICGM